jgi:hypothetical protein
VQGTVRPTRYPCAPHERGAIVKIAAPAAHFLNCDLKSSAQAVRAVNTSRRIRGLLCSENCSRLLPASPLVSSGVRFRLSPATCDASTPRSRDYLSTGARGLRLILLPAPDGAFPAPQDALLWIYREVSSGQIVGGSLVGRSGAVRAPDPQFATLSGSCGCAWLPVKRQAPICRECCVFNTVQVDSNGKGKDRSILWAVLFSSTRE